MNDLISVLTTAYNAERYIGETIESILNQDYKDFEYIILDDGSTDRTVEIINEFKDYRIHLIRPGRVGRGAALNKAIEESKGRYIAIQDADDVSHPNRLSTEIKYLKSINDQALIGAVQIEFFKDNLPAWPSMNSNSIQKKYLTDVRNGLLYFNPISHTSMMIPRDILEKVGRYNQARKNLYDWDLYLRVIANGFGIYRLSIPLVGKRLHEDQFFERKDRFSYLYGSLKLQLRATVLLKKYIFALFSIPVLFSYRLLPVKLRIGSRPFIKALFRK